MKSRKSVITAAERFTKKLMPEFSEQRKEQFGEKEGAAWAMIEAAFFLYQREWDQYDIENWQWPFIELNRDDGFRENNNPWTVLLREAVSLLRVHA